VEGRVFGAASLEELVNARVELSGHGVSLSMTQGMFRFEGVAPGSYTLRVDAFGYNDFTTSVQVHGNVFLPIPLDPRPFELDSLTVEARTVGIDGRVRDAQRGVWVMDAQVTSDQGQREYTRSSGRFDLDGVQENVPLRVRIGAFGYLPLDTVIVPTEDSDHQFNLLPDPLMESMIGFQTERLEERVQDIVYAYGPVMNRDEISGFDSSRLLHLVMEAKYPSHVLQRVGCMLLDERELRQRWERTALLETPVGTLERFELLEIPGLGRQFMLRVYTRSFMQRMVATNPVLREPQMNGPARICR